MRDFWKRMMCLGLMFALMLQLVPVDGWSGMEKRVEAASIPSEDINKNELLSDKFIVNPQLLEFLKELLANHTGKLKTQVTIGDLMEYDGEIILTDKEKDVGNIQGLGYARKAKKFDVSKLVLLDKVAEWEFYYCNMEEIVLPDNVTTIEANAFNFCKNLQTIHMPNKLRFIREDAFNGCSKLNGVVIPDGIESIGAQAFLNCTSLTYIRIPNPSVTLGRGAFMNCTLLIYVELPEGLETIPTECFSGTVWLTYLTFPSSLKKIENHAFNGSGIIDVDLSHTRLQTIGDYAFGNTYEIDIRLPDTLESIGTLAFEYSDIERIELPEGLRTLGAKAFIHCKSLESVSIPSTLDAILEETFNGCNALERVTIENSIQKSVLGTIKKKAFFKCYSLPGTRFLKGLEYLKEIGDEAFADCYYVPQMPVGQNMVDERDVFGDTNKVGNFKIVELPSCVETLGESVFSNGYVLEKVTLRNTGVTELPKNAFKNCDKLQSVDLPQRLERIGESCFENCRNLKKIVFPDNTLKQIGDYAFRACGRYSLAANNASAKAYQVVWTYVNKDWLFKDFMSEEGRFLEAFVIDEEEMNGVRYKQAKQVYIKLSKVVNGKETFDRYTRIEDAYEQLAKDMSTSERDGYVKVGVPMYATCYNDYKNRNDGSDLAKYAHCSTSISMEVKEGTFVNNYAGVGNVFTGLEEMSVPNSVTSIGRNVFQNCLNLKEVETSRNMAAIPDYTFSGCGTRIRTLNSSNSNDAGVIDRYAYTGLTSVTLKDDLEVIGNYAFDKCYAFNLIDGQLPGTLTSIGNYAFNECSSLTKFVVPRSLRTIGNYAFYRASTIETYQYYYNDNGTWKWSSATNAPERGRGLSEVDFQTATQLTGVGNNAFAYTSLTEVDLMPAVNAKTINASTFEGCRYLREFTGGNAIEYIGANAFKDNENLRSVSVPATTVLNQNMFLGNTNSSLGITLRNATTRNVGVNLGEETEVPLYAISDSNKNGNGLEVTVLSGAERILHSTNTKKTMNFQNANFNINLLKVVGKEEGEAQIRVGCKMQFATVGSHNIVTEPVLDYLVNVQRKSCESITFDKDRYYMSVTNTATGITLTPEVKPEDATDPFEWSLSTASQDVVKMEPLATISPVDGSSKVLPKAKVTAKKLGEAEITLKAGSKQATCYVDVVVPATRVTLSKTSMNLSIGMEERVEATLTYQNGHDLTLGYLDKAAFASSDESVVTVDSDGNVNAVGLGTATITARAMAASNQSATCTVTVSPEEMEVYLKYEGKLVSEIRDAIRADAGSKLNFEIQTVPEDVKSSVRYSFSKEGILDAAWIGESNRVTGLELTPKKPGVTTLSVYPAFYDTPPSNIGSKSKVDLEVVADATEIRLNTTVKTLDVGKTANLFQSISSKLGTITKSSDIPNMPNITSDTVTFTSDNPSVATVDANCVVTGVSAGKVTITATSERKYGGSISSSLEIEVVRPNATSVEINGEKTIRVGQTIRYTAALNPKEAGNAVTFSLANPNTGASILSVTSDGWVTGLAKGTAGIRATTDNGKTKDFNITVTQPVTAIVWTKAKIHLDVGKTYTLKSNTDYILEPNGASDTITWSSDNPGVATVDPKSGLIKAVARGTATIFGTTSTGLTTQVNVNVLTPVTAITITNQMLMNVGQKAEITINVTPSDATDALTWTSSNEKVATVNGAGVVTAVAKGTCNITVKSTSNKTATCKVTVKQPARSVKVQAATANQKTIYMAKKGTLSLKSALTPSNSDDTLKWSSSKKKVATVNESTGVVTAVKKGKAKITLKASSGKKASINVIVVNKAVAAKKITISKKKTVKRNQTIRLAPKISPKKSTDTLTWRSGNPSIARIDAYGNLVGVKKGKTNVTVRTLSGKISTCKVTVK